MSSIRQVFQWRVCVAVCGGAMVWVNHEACQQYEKKLDALKSSINVAVDNEFLSHKQKVYGYFEGTLHSTVPLVTPPSPSHGHRSFDMVLLQEYTSTVEAAKVRFSPTASYKERVWETNPPYMRNRDSGLCVGVGGVVTVEDPKTGVVVKVDPSFLPLMRLKQLFYYDSASTLSFQEKFTHGQAYTQQHSDYYQDSDRESGDGGESDGESEKKTSQQRVHVVGGLPVGQTVCIIGDFVCEEHEAGNMITTDTSGGEHTYANMPSKHTTISVVSSEPSSSILAADQANKRISGSFFGSFDDVTEGKRRMYEGYRRLRLVGGMACTCAVALLLLFP